MYPDDFHIQGYRYSLANSKSLLKIADKSADEEEYGIACSLNILAAEEAVKGIAIILSINNVTEDFHKIFKDHKTKHRHLLVISYGGV